MIWLLVYGRWFFYDGKAYVNDELLLEHSQIVRNTVKRNNDFEFGVSTAEFERLLESVDENSAEPYLTGGTQYTSFIEMHSGLHSIATVHAENCTSGVVLHDTLSLCDQEAYNKIQSELLEMVNKKRAFRSFFSFLQCQRFGGC